MNKSAFRKLSYGVYLISTLDGSRPLPTALCRSRLIRLPLPSASIMTTIQIPALKKQESSPFPFCLKPQIQESLEPLDSSPGKTSINFFLFPLRLPMDFH